MSFLRVKMLENSLGGLAKAGQVLQVGQAGLADALDRVEMLQ
jgi:hypothetical protein